MRRLRIWILPVMAVVLMASLLTPPAKSDRTSDPLMAGARIAPQVLAILQRACQDCHSERTYYPWYSYIAPVSWLIENDISQGRTHLNLSRWNEYPRVRQERALSEIANQVKDREMPLWQYTLIHRDARLSDAEGDAVFQWTQNERARLIEEGLPATEPRGSGAIKKPFLAVNERE